MTVVYLDVLLAAVMEDADGSGAAVAAIFLDAENYRLPHLHLVHGHLQGETRLLQEQQVSVQLRRHEIIPASVLTRPAPRVVRQMSSAMPLQHLVVWYILQHHGILILRRYGVWSKFL